MGKQYQTRDAEASTPQLTIPEQVSVALAEIAESAKEGLLALAVGAGLQVLGTLMEESVVALAGPKGKHDPDRVAVRHGHEQGSVVLGGRRIPVQRPRVRAADGSGELPVAAYELFSSTEVLGRLALERMLGGLSTRRYGLGLEPVGTRVEQAATGTSKSAVSRRFVAMTHTALAELLAADLSTLDLVCLMVDGVHFGEHCCVVALASPSRGPSTRWPWSRAPLRTPPWPPSCWSGCASAAWIPPGRSCVCWTAPRRCTARSWTCSTIPCWPDASSTRSATSATSCPSASAGRSSTACAPPTTLPPPWTPKPSYPRWPVSSTRPTPARRRACARGWPRPSRCCGWACRRPWPARSAQRT